LENPFELCLAGWLSRWTYGLALTDVVNDKALARHWGSHEQTRNLNKQS